ncbi:MAG: 30S ribosomal protein S20 [Eubacteriales bacterium]
MANIKSAKKRVITSQKREEHNQGIRSAVKTSVKKVESLVEAGDKEAASKALLDATSTIDKAASKGILHKNNASRKVSRLSKAVNSIE